VLPLPAIAIRRLATVPALAWVATVAVVSALAAGRPAGWVEALAASPERVREGKVWFLFTSAGLVDHPVVISVLSFAALATLAWLVCGMNVFWLSAFLGQVGATLLVYLYIGAARWVVPGAYAAATGSPDYGVSTVSAAWLGSIATVAWQKRGRSRSGKASIALGCVAVTLFAYSVRPDVTVLSSEHVVAFTLGVVGALPGLGRKAIAVIVHRRVRRTALTRAGRAGREGNRATATALTAGVLTLAVVAAPVALGTLRREIAVYLPPTASRCVAAWNRLSATPRSVVEGRAIRLVTLTVIRLTLDANTSLRAGTETSTAAYCRYIFSAQRSSAIVVLGLWRHGAVARWTVATPRHLPDGNQTNAALLANGRIHLDHQQDRRVILSS
jgi:hypothetical protein